MNRCPICRSKCASLVVDYSRSYTVNFLVASKDYNCLNCGLIYTKSTSLANALRKSRRYFPLIVAGLFVALCYEDFSTLPKSDVAIQKKTPMKRVIPYVEDNETTLVANHKVRSDIKLVNASDTVTFGLDEAVGSTTLNALSFTPRVLKHSDVARDAINPGLTVFERVEQVLVSWRNSWQVGDLEEYFEHYSDNFDVNGQRVKSLSEWQKKRTNVISKAGEINIDLDNIRILRTSGEAYIARFTQRYQSENYQDVVEKELRFVDEDGGIKIVKENVVPSSVQLTLNGTISL